MIFMTFFILVHFLAVWFACLLTLSTVLASQSFWFNKKSLSSNLELIFFLSFVFFSHLFFGFYLHISCGCGIVSSPLPSLVFRHWFASRFKSGSRARQPPQQAVLRFGTPLNFYPYSPSPSVHPTKEARLYWFFPYVLIFHLSLLIFHWPSFPN